MNLRDIKPSLISIQKSLLKPSNRLGSPGDLAGDIKIDQDYLYYCIADYSSVNTEILITFNYSSGIVLEKNSGVTSADIESFRVLQPTGGIGAWKLSCPSLGISNVDITTSTVSSNVSIEIDTNDLSGTPINQLVNKSCTLSGRASIWRRISWNSSSWS